MGRTLPSITQALLIEQGALGRFRRALRRSDQLALDDLFASARQHLAAAQFAAHATCCISTDHTIRKLYSGNRHMSDDKRHGTV